ncbi:hypothetical protein NCAS_0I00440 [Naumovozyma castellii]|uniref:Glutathione synthetase n=1 Tax=Naumovozyma castellii TaxID=27288 RepID=G0VJN2_NAUCA|nr:hypothetical protein NCAS_0I00440 [Naumovozyma castellii CBS 4309]CCC71712.1 hypothetical protein NCAS_0I00440 [Naumovozyma castellii CBS 4309]
MTSKKPALPQLSKESLEKHLLPELYQWALSHGLLVYKPETPQTQTAMVALTTYPTPVPRACFESAQEVQVPFNELYARISSSDWLYKETKLLSASDEDFTGKLFAIQLKLDEFATTVSKDVIQPLRLGIFRSDYIVDKNSNSIKQVEFNTVSVSFSGFSGKVAALHQTLDSKGLYQEESNRTPFFQPNYEIPVSFPSAGFAKAMEVALSKYDTPNDRANLVVAFIVQRGERNVFDQKCIENELWENHGIKTVRLNFDDVLTELKLDANSNRLYMKHTGQEVGLVYYRTGYTTSDYEIEKDWDARFFLEKSYAIKAPDLMTQLSGAKKVQQLLTDDTILTKFVKDEHVKDQLKETFVKIFPLDDTPLGEEGKRLAMESPHNYVLKPQREGGGNNIYKEDIPGFLRGLDKDQWNGYILMELIDSDATEGNIICNGDSTFAVPILSELGVYGTVLFDHDSNILYNESPGWLLRSKFGDSNEGGVAAGFGCLDSVVLY